MENSALLVYLILWNLCAFVFSDTSQHCKLQIILVHRNENNPVKIYLILTLWILTNFTSIKQIHFNIPDCLYMCLLFSFFSELVETLH